MTAAEEMAAVERARDGDSSAFELLVNEHQKNVYNLALRMVGNEDDAFDMSQEAFLRAYRSISTFHGDSKFSVWLYRLTSNVCIDFLRAKKRRPESSLSYLNSDDETEELALPDLRYNPEDELEKKEFQTAVSRGLDALPADYRQILVLRELHGLSYDEIGSVLSIESGTVKSRLFRARRKLCAFLVRDGNIPAFFASDRIEGGA